MLPIQEDPDGLTFKIYVQPRSRKSEIVGLHGDAVKIRITAPPVEGAANAMCIGFLAKSLKVPKSSIEIANGHSGRNKRVRVACRPSTPAGKSREDLKAALRSLLRH